MCQEDRLIEIVDFIYEAVLDPELWPSILSKLANVMDATQIAMATLDRRDQSFASIAPRTDPDLVTSYRQYWAFHNPLWTGTTNLPVGEVFTLDSLMPRGDFAKTEIFNEWWAPAEYGFAMLGANLLVEKDLSALICVVNAPKKDDLDPMQDHVFRTVLRHIDRAIRIHRRLWNLDLARATAIGNFDKMPDAVFLVDAASRVLFHNRTAKEMLDGGGEIVVTRGCLGTKDNNSEILQQLIASCGQKFILVSLNGRGGEFTIMRGQHRAPLRIAVTPLRANGSIPEVPWLGLRAPVAVVTVTDPDLGRRRLEQHLREQYGLTPAESSLASEISRGDGRKAAAQRRGIAVSTARAQLSSIFDKTGTRRQAELVRLLQDFTVRRDDPR
jgi:DNA-binding CsgD family transcriptional regulator